MAKRLSFSIAVNLLTENFKKGTNTVKNSLRSMQMQVITFAAALGAGGLGISGLLSRFRDVVRETSRVLTALKNVSGGTKEFADNLRFVNNLAKKYGMEVTALTGNFASFTASATQANMPMEEQKKVFESLSRASTAFNLSAQQTDGVFLALSQMMGKGKISMEELRKQMGEKLPIAIQAMAKALGVSIAKMEKMISSGKVMSADVLPKFAKALDEMITDVDTDNLESSLNKLSNTFGDIVNSSGFQNKYKALIDGLTSLLESASNNIQNIIIGIVAAIGFVVTNGLTKVYRGYAATGKQIVANATITHNKLRAAIAARVEAEKRFEELKLQHAQAVGRAQVTLAKQIEKQKQLLSARTTQVNIAHENAKVAAAQAAAIKSRGAWVTTWATISGSAKKLMVSLKSMWSTFTPAIIISGLIAIGGYIKNLYDKTRRLEKATEDYDADVEKETVNINILFNRLRSATEGTEKYNKAKNEILSKYGDYLKGLSDEITSLKDVEGAYKAISKAAIQAAKDRAIESNTNEATNDYLKVFKRNAANLKKTLEKEFGKEKGTMLFDSVVEQLSTNGNIDQETKAIIDSLNKTYVSAQGTAGTATSYTVNNAALAIGEIMSAKDRLDKEIEEISSIFGKTSSNVDEVVEPIKPKKELDDKALLAAEKRLEALRKLDEEDRKRQIENLKFKQDMEQKAIDLMDDSFEKRQRQIKLNYEKEKTAIEEEQNRLLKEQSEYIKNKFVSVNGTDKGFESYLAELKKNNFKGKDGIDILPEDLRPENIASRISKILDAAQKEYDKASRDNIEHEKQSWNEYYKAYGDYQQKKLAITQLYADKIAKASTAGEKATLKKEQEKEIANLFTTLPDYETFFTSIYSLTKSKAIEIGNLIKKNLKDQLDKGVISANEYYESIKKINEELEKSAKGIDYFGKMQSGGIEGLLGAIKERADSDFGKATQDITQANTDFGKSFADWGKAFQAGDTSAASIAQNSMVSATNMQGAAQGAMQGAQGMQQFAGAAQGAVQMVDMIVTAIDQSVRATQRIVDVFADLAEQRGIDTNKGTWAEVKETMSVISKINEKGKQSWDSLKSGDAVGSFASAVEMVAIAFKSVNGEHREALKLLKRQEDQQKHLYEIEKLRASLEKHGETIFGSDGWGKASNAVNVYKSSVENLNESLEKLQDVDVVTGSKKSGWGPFKKRKDVWTDLLKAYPELIDANGKFDKSLAETILSTRTLTDEGKEFLQQAINNAELVEEAFAGMSDYLSGIFGDLGKTMLSAFTEAFKGTKNAIADLKNDVSDMLADLVADFIYSMRLAPIIEKASKEAEQMMLDSSLSDDEKNRKLIDITGNLINGILDQQDNIFADLDYWGKVIANATGGKNPFDKDSVTTQDSTKGYSVSMDQDTGGAILGRITGIHESIIEIKSMMSTVNVDTAKCFQQSVIIGDELKKHTGIFYEMQQMQMKSYRKIESISEGMGVFDGMKTALDEINKNTKNL